MFLTDRFVADHFQDADGIVGLLAAFGLPVPNRDAARKWVARSSIPSDWLPVLLAAAELENGQPIRMAQYIIWEA